MAQALTEWHRHLSLADSDAVGGSLAKNDLYARLALRALAPQVHDHRTQRKAHGTASHASRRCTATATARSHCDA